MPGRGPDTWRQSCSCNLDARVRQIEIGGVIVGLVGLDDALKQVDNVCEKPLADVWQSEGYVRFRARVRDFRFMYCVACGAACDYAENNKDCLGNVPSCADCLWAQGMIRCP